MIKKRLKLLKQTFKNHKIDGYVIPKNDEYFSEYFSGIPIVEPRVELENPNPSEEKIPAEVNQK